MEEPLPNPTAIRELLVPLDKFEKEINELPDSRRAQFIGIALRSTALAIRLDKPSNDLRGLFETQFGMMKDCLDAWSAEDGF